jgi:hypothetical protein
MMQKTVLTIELERVRVITNNPGRRVLFCEACQATSQFVDTEEAVKLVKLFEINTPETFHFYQTAEKKLFVCLNSIFEKS